MKMYVRNNTPTDRIMTEGKLPKLRLEWKKKRLEF